MIIVNISGGLGNQLFNYAFGRGLSEFYNVPLKLDVTGYRHNRLRQYALGDFNIREDFASAEEVARLKKTDPGSFVSKFRYLAEAAKPIRHRGYIREAGFSFDRRMFELEMDRDRYFKGRWQSEKYFKPIEAQLRSELALRPHLQDERYARTEQVIRNANAVSLHVRRGDYVASKSTFLVHGACSSGYYQKAIGMIEQRTERPAFFVFSDDIDWVKQNLRFASPVTYVSGQGLSDTQELSLMSLCRHHVIANSTFSWWAAWLCEAENKIVIAPKRWFGYVLIDTSDLLPADWLAI
jgi:hypothetical protein